MTTDSWATASPPEVRAAIRAGLLRGTTAGLAPGHAQANLVVVEREWAADLARFCLLNPRPCPLLDVTRIGSPVPARLAPAADVRTDLPGYRVHREGVVQEVADLREEWHEGLVAFLIGCSFSFERALRADGIPVRHIDLGRTVPMYVTSLECAPAGRIRGPMVVSMRPVAADAVERMVEISSRFPGAHGAPVHIGDPAEIGIAALDRPDFGDAVPVAAGEVPVFWGCGVTPQVVLSRSGCRWFAGHLPGQMFVSDREDDLMPLTELPAWPAPRG